MNPRIHTQEHRNRRRSKGFQRRNSEVEDSTRDRNPHQSSAYLLDDNNGLESYLSPEVKQLLIKFKHSKTKNPFSREHQGIIDKFVQVVRKIEENAQTGNTARFNLTEAALLLECSVKVFSKQVDDTRSDVFKIAEFLTTAHKSNTEQGTIRLAENDSPSNDSATENPEPQEVMVSDWHNMETEIMQDTTRSCSNDATETEAINNFSDTAESVSAIPDPENLNENTLPEKDTSEPTMSEEGKKNQVIDVITILDDEPMPVRETNVAGAEREISDVGLVEPVPDESITEGSVPEGSVPEDSVPEESILTAVTNPKKVNLHARNTRRNPCKREKKDYGPPPILISCFDEEIVYHSDDSEIDDEPPKLKAIICRARQRVSDENVAPVHGKSQDVRSPRLSGCKEGILDPDLSLLIQSPNSKTGEYIQSKPEDTNIIISDNSEGVVIKAEPTDKGYAKNEQSVVPMVANIPHFLNSINPISLGNFSPEDETQIQTFINQLHYLLFTCELTKEELAKTFEYAVERLEAIYKQHNVPIHRHLVQATAQACSHYSSSYAKWLEIEKNILPDPTVLHELFSQRIRQQREKNSEDSLLTIMDLTQEKTKTQSDIKLRQMLTEMQRFVIPQYTKIPLIEENTEGFFRRVKSFENRMKKILAEEERKEEFDIRKYEMDVLDVTHKESHEMSEGSHVNSPMLLLSPELSPQPFPKFSLDGLPSPSSSDSGDGIKWIPLNQIFTHMKTPRRHEAARMFYAILALLSFQNLDIKYDNHYSAESAALISKNLDHSLGTKYPRGVKIMTSRCPNVNTEEVYISALTSKSRTEIFRELEAHHRELEVQEEHNAHHQDTPPPEPQRNGARRLYEELRVDIQQDTVVLKGNFMEINGLLTAATFPNRKRSSTAMSLEDSCPIKRNLPN